MGEYTALDIGAHCSFCKQHDFLPFKCESCGFSFCLKHKDASKHECTHSLCCKGEGKKNDDGQELSVSAMTLDDNELSSVSYDGIGINNNDNNNNSDNLKTI